MHPVRLKLKTVSTNKIWAGRKYKTKEAKTFEKDASMLLEQVVPQTILPEGDLTIHFRFGTTRRKDLSNNIKLLEDVIARHFGIDDRRFSGHTAVRVPVKSGDEFIIFHITEFIPNDFPSLHATL